jgi:chromosome segregation ATPase
VQRAEAELRKRRDVLETDVLQEAARTQASALTWSENCAQEIKDQDHAITNMTKTLRETMDKRQRTNVQKLLQAIEHDQGNNKEEIRELNEQLRELDGEYEKFKGANQRIQMELPRLQDSTLTELHKAESDAQASLTQQVQQLEDKINYQNKKAQDSVKVLSTTQKELVTLKEKAETLSTKIEIAQSISTFYDSLKYPQRIQELKRFGVQESQQKAAALEKQITDMSNQWTQMYEMQHGEIKKAIQTSSQQQTLEHISSLVAGIRAKEEDIADIQSEIDQIMSEQPSKIDDEQLEGLKQTVQKKVTEYKLRLNDKAALFEEMYAKALLLINSDAQIIQNQEEIMQLKHEIDINILEIEQKSVIINELQNDLL